MGEIATVIGYRARLEFFNQSQSSASIKNTKQRTHNLPLDNKLNIQ